MPAPKSRELLSRLLQGDTPSPAEVLALVKAFRAQEELEGQWFDLKAGALLRNKQGDELRTAVCGFANAEGGFLLIGYDETAQAFDGVLPVRKQTPEQWVTDALGSIAAYIPSPRVTTLTVEDKAVLLVAIARATRLVFVIEDGAAVYYLRFGHQTRKMPQSLVTDLMLGRKAQPALRVSDVRVMGGEPRLVPDAVRASTIDLLLRVNYENDALILAEMPRVGLVSWSTDAPGRDLPQQLRRAVELVTPPDDLLLGGYQWDWHPVTTLEKGPDLEAFAPGTADIRHARLPVFDPIQPRPGASPAEKAQARGALEVMSALYLIATDAEPTWWQLVFRYDNAALGRLNQHAPRHLQCVPCLYSRPVVSLRFLPEGESVELPPS